jgi:Leucine-rich repeat (LRR) protein
VSEIDLEAYNLTGSLPSSLQAFKSMQVLYLFDNAIGGSIPAAIGNMTVLETLNLSDNLLTGTIPDTLGNLLGVTYFTFELNNLHGSIPGSLCDLHEITFFGLTSNNLTGTVPSCISNYRGLHYLYMSSNKLTGSMPDYNSFPRLREYDLDVNHFSGPFPTPTINMSDLRIVDIGVNALTGPIPTDHSLLASVTDFVFSENAFTGSIPASIGNVPQITSFEVDNNQLTDSLPDAVGTLPILNYLNTESNQLTGSIPASLLAIGGLSQVNLQNNFLTGSIANTFTSASTMQVMYLNTNLLTGSLPESIGNMTKLEELQLEYNLLTGPVPELSRIRRMQTFNAHNNHLTGSLQSVFDPTVQTILNYVQLNDNALTGTLPEDLYALPALTTLVLATNCFSGTLSASLCNSSVSSAILDGLSSAPACRRRLFRSTSSFSYALRRSVSGTIPACLFAMPDLNTLHLAGNEFTGTLPGAHNVSNALVDLSISHNILTGTIPAPFQNRKWYNLDLSYNRLGGTLLEVTPTTTSSIMQELYNATTVSLENNRLSGKIPAALLPLANVSLLGTNLFECHLDGSNLPQHDTGSANYQCGSSNFNVPYYLWMAAVAAAAAGVIMLTHSNHPASVYVRDWLQLLSSTAAENTNLSLRTTLGVFDAVNSLSCWITVYIVVVLVPVYVALSFYASTLTHAYAWAVSAAYRSGAAAVAVEYPALLGVPLVGLVAAVRAGRTLVLRSVPKKNEEKHSHAGRTALAAVYFLLNVIVVGGVNLLYVYIAIYQSSALLVLAQVLMSFFKLAWNTTGTDLLRDYIFSHADGTGVKNSSSEMVHHTASTKQMLQIVVALTNNIAIPCLVVACISPDCFYNVFVSAPTVHASYLYKVCITVEPDSTCHLFNPAIDTVSYRPPFRYNYQCSSSLITYYAPAFINLCLVSTFLSPAGLALLKYLHSRAAPGTRWYRLLDSYCLPRLLKPLPAADACRADASNSYAKPGRLLCLLVTYLGLLATFGATFPPLAVALLVTILAATFFEKLNLGHFLAIARAQKELATYAGYIERDCEGVTTQAVLSTVMWVLLTFSCWFYALFLFDTLGDAVGFDGAYWVLIAMPLTPVCAYAVHRLRTAHHYGDGEDAGAEKGGKGVDGVELRATIASAPTHDGEEAPTVSALHSHA